MSRFVTCFRPTKMWGREFDRKEVVDVDAFADALGRDAEWLYRKMLRPMIQVGMIMVPCFEAATGGGAEEDELPAESAGPLTTPEPEESEGSEEEEPGDAEPEAPSYPIHRGFGKWELSDGSEVQGKSGVAREAQDALDRAEQFDRAETPEETTN